jgi:CubicO group peptidase (beta-lactamase class C family)
VIVYLVLFLVGLVNAQKDSLFIDLDNNIRAWLTEYNVPAVGIGFIDEGKTKSIKIFGELKKGFRAPVNTIFNIASITKPVIAVMTLKLVQQGHWDLDEPLFHYWIDPDVANDEFHKKLTTRHILTHQTGFLNWRFQEPDNKLSFKFEPGTNYQYSGEGFVYLTRALETKFKKSLTELTDSLLFNPLGMKDSRLYWDRNMDESRFAYWHDSKGNMHNPATSRDRGTNAASSMLTTVEDFCKFGIDIVNGIGVSPFIYAEMTRAYVTLHQHHHWGLGWEVITGLPEGEFALEHGGSDRGVQSTVILLPKSKRGIVIFTNGDNGKLISNKIIKEYLDVGEAIFKITSGAADDVILTLPNHVLEKYTGVFLDTYGRELTVIKAGSTLKMSGKGIPTVTLYAKTNNKFFMKDLDVNFQFISNDSLIIIANGKVDCTAKRLK